MLRTISSYAIVSRIIGTLFLVAGVLKYFEIVSMTLTRSEALLGWSVVLLEILYGIWLLIGPFPVPTRYVAMGCLLGLAHLALVQALQGKPSCGCFGKVPVRPWVVLTFDICGFLALGFSNVINFGSAIRLMVFGAMGSIAAILVSLGFFGGAIGASAANAAKLPEDSKSLIERAAASIEKNYADLGPVSFHMTSTRTNPNIKKEEVKVTYPSPNSKAVVRRKPVTILRYQYSVQGEEVRRDTYLDDSLISETMVIRPGESLQYIPSAGRAILQKTPHVEANPIDPRCLGFNGSVRNVSQWLRTTKIVDVRNSDSEDFLIVRADIGSQIVEAKLDATKNYLPKHVTYFHDDSSINFHAELECRYFESNRAWVIVAMDRWLYDKGVAHAPRAPGYTNHWRYQIGSELVFNPDFTSGIFDPTLPAKTSVRLKSRSIRLSEGRTESSTRARFAELHAAVPSSVSIKGIVLAALALNAVTLFLYVSGRGLLAHQRRAKGESE